MFNKLKTIVKPAMKTVIAGAVLASVPLGDIVPVMDTSAVAQNVCANGKPFKSSRKNISMNTRVYRKYEKVLELVDLASEAGKQSDALKSQAKELNALADAKVKEKLNDEAAMLRSQAQTLLSQAPTFDSQKTAHYKEAEDLINDVTGSSRTADYDRGSMLQLYSQVNFELGDTKAAIGNLEEMMNYRTSFKETRVQPILYSLAQLQYSEEQYDTALKYLNEWFEISDIICHKISTSQNTFIAQLYYVKQDYRNSLKHMYTAINATESDPEAEVKEQWYQMVASSHYELGEIDKYRDTLEIMVVKWGKPEYYKRLAGVHQELNDEDTSYSLFEAIYEMGWMDKKENELKMIAQIQFARQSPIKATWILESALADGRMEENIDNTRLLYQAYMASAEFEKAVGPMTKVAEESQSAQIFLELGNIEYSNGNYNNSVRLFDKSIALFKKQVNKKSSAKKKSANSRKIQQAMIGKGAALLDRKDIMDACKVFKQIERMTNSKRTKRLVKSYKRAVEGDIARQDMFNGKDTGRKCK